MSGLPFLDVPTAVAVGRRVVPAGPRLSASEIEAVVGGLRVAAAMRRRGRRPDRPSDVGRGERPHGGDHARGGGRPCRRRSPSATGSRKRVNAAQLAGALAVFGSRILGRGSTCRSWPSPGGARRPERRQVGTGARRRPRGLPPVGLPARADAPGAVRPGAVAAGHLAAAVAPILSDAEGGPRPRELWRGSLTEVLSTPQQRAAFEHVSAVMALLEGYADDMMDRVGPEGGAVRGDHPGPVRAAPPRRPAWRRWPTARWAWIASSPSTPRGPRSVARSSRRSRVTGLNAVHEGPGTWKHPTKSTAIPGAG